MTDKKVFALVDCNNFFASCEQVFRPDIIDKPVAVLSNNDGCIVARSNEVKKLGIPMGVPEFQYRNILQKNGVKLFSANFELYGDFSRRIVELLEAETPYVEVYSVDEAFLEVSSLSINNYDKWAKTLRKKILKAVGIPVSIGVAQSKTLAKAASEIAKKTESLGGALSLINQKPQQVDIYLKSLDVGDVWGVGRRSAPKLHEKGIFTAYDLAGLTDKQARSLLKLGGEKTVRELKGQSCIPFGTALKHHAQKSLAVTRSFGHSVNALSELESAVVSFVLKAGARLRRQGQIAGGLVVFLRTNQRTKDAYRPAKFIPLPIPSADNSDLIKAALEALQSVYRQEHSYKKAGVVLVDLRLQSAKQLSLTEPRSSKELKKRQRLMDVLDAINNRYGTDTLTLAAKGTTKKQRWLSKHERRSPRFTTRWGELPVIKHMVS